MFRNYVWRFYILRSVSVIFDTIYIIGIFWVDKLECSEGNVFVCVFVCGGGGGVQAHVIETLTVRLKIIAYCYTTW